jgi:hypothetical protein
VGVEGARQRGLRIEHLGDAPEKKAGPDWLEKEVASYEQFKKSRQLAMA